MASTQTPNQNSANATQDFLIIEEIHDGVVILRDGGMRMVLMVSSLNFALKSEDEQQAIFTQYQNFLNSLDFHIQFFIQSRRLNIAPYLQTLEERSKEQVNDLIKIQTREYIEFIKNFSESTNIMAKTFFAVVPYNPPSFNKSGGFLSRFFTKKTAQETAATSIKDFADRKTQLEQRAEVVTQGLSRMGLRTAVLGTEELVELFFKLFNPGEVAAPNSIAKV